MSLNTTLQQTISQLLRTGYDDPETIVAMAVEEAEDSEDDNGDEDLSAVAEQVFDRELMTLQTQQAAWPATTDNDRLAQAFASLEAQRIVCRENWTCCQTCGHAEIGEEIANLQKQGRMVAGYAFFHQQDTESAVDGDGLYLAYGGEGMKTLEVGKKIASAMREAGLEVDWDETEGTRIGVKLQWRKRWTRGERKGQAAH